MLRLSSGALNFAYWPDYGGEEWYNTIMAWAEPLIKRTFDKAFE